MPVVSAGQRPASLSAGQRPAVFMCYCGLATLHENHDILAIKTYEHLPLADTDTDLRSSDAEPELIVGKN